MHGILLVYGFALAPFPPCFATDVCTYPCPLYCHNMKWQLRGQGQGQRLMAKHGGKGDKGKNNTTEDRAKISVSRARARARAKIDDKTWRKWGQGQKRHPEAKIGQKYEF